MYLLHVTFSHVYFQFRAIYLLPDILRKKLVPDFYSQMVWVSIT